MAKKITRSELNTNLYEKLDDEIGEIRKTSLTNNNKLMNIKKRLSLIDSDYFSQIIDEIDETIGIQSLYLDSSLTEEEKFLGIKNALQNYLDEINSIVDQNLELIDNFDEVFNLTNDQVAIGVDAELTKLMEKLKELPSLQQKNQEILKDFQRLYPGLEKNLLIIDEKFETEKDGGIPYRDRLLRTQNNNKMMITEIKRNLNQYKIKWLWYVLVVVLLILGIVLVILIPIFVV